MILICRAVLALIVDVLICYLWGEAILGNFYKRICHPFTDILIGFLLGQGIFQLVTLGCYFAGGELTQVILLWSLCVAGMCVWGICTWIRNRRKPAASHHKGKQTLLAAAATLVVVIAFCYYVCINGELNEDSRYYVGLVNVTMNTGTLFQYNAFNGVQGDSWYLRRALATYEIQSAVIGKVFHLPAILVTRYMRAWEDVLLSSMTVYIFGKRILWQESESETTQTRKSCGLVVLFLLFQLIYARSYSSSGMFFLIRAYEGKAIVANVLTLLTLYLCAEYMRSRERRLLLLQALALWGATAVSTSGMVVIAAEIGLICIAGSLYRIFGKRGAR